MEWIKIPTDEILLPTRSDWQNYALIKYMALYCQLEEEPNEIQLRKILTPKQFNFVQKEKQIVLKIVKNCIENVSKKRMRDKLHYDKKSFKNSDDFQIPLAERQRTDVTDKIRKEKNRLDNNNPPISPLEKVGYDASFEEFWEMYIPVKCTDGRFTDKGSKQQAYKAFKKALEKDSFENIKEGLIRYLQKKAMCDSMTANVSTFLNQERWKDESEDSFILSDKTLRKQQEDSGQQLYDMITNFVKG